MLFHHILGIIDITDPDLSASHESVMNEARSRVNIKSCGIGHERRPAWLPPELQILHASGIQLLQPCSSYLVSTQLRAIHDHVYQRLMVWRKIENIAIVVQFVRRLPESFWSQKLNYKWTQIRMVMFATLLYSVLGQIIQGGIELLEWKFPWSSTQGLVCRPIRAPLLKESMGISSQVYLDGANYFAVALHCSGASTSLYGSGYCTFAVALPIPAAILYPSGLVESISWTIAWLPCDFFAYSSSVKDQFRSGLVVPVLRLGNIVPMSCFATNICVPANKYTDALCVPAMNYGYADANTLVACWIQTGYWKISLLLSHILILEIGTYFAPEMVSKNYKLDSEFVQQKNSWSIRLTPLLQMFPSGSVSTFPMDNFVLLERQVLCLFIEE